MMANIPLFGKRGLGKFAVVDEDDVKLVTSIRWYVNDTGYAVNRNKGVTIRMHRLINKTPLGLVTDHKNGNTLDNRKSNLRTVTYKENVLNNHSVKGYTWDDSKQRWMVRYRGLFYGRYITEPEAQKAYKLACSGVAYKKTRRKLWHLPTGVSKQFGKYRVRPQKNGVKYWLGAYATISEAERVLRAWKERG